MPPEPPPSAAPLAGAPLAGAPAATAAPPPALIAAALAQLSEGVVVADRAGRIVFVNEAAACLHGVARLDVGVDEYAAAYRLFTEDGCPYPSAELPLARAVLRGESVVGARWRIRRPDGSEILAVGSARPVFGPGGERLGAVLTLRDDAARADAERADRRATRILERVGDAHVALDRELRYVAVNAAGERSMGRPREALLGRTLLEAFPSAAGSESERQYRRVAAEGVAAHFVEHYVGDGLDVHVEVDAYPVADERGDGTGFGVAVFWRDITARVRAEEALARQSALTRLVADNATSALFLMDAGGHPTYMNPAAQAMTGFELAEISGMPLHYAVHHHRPDGTLYPMAECPIDRALPEHFDVRAHEDVFIRKDGSFFPVACAASPILEGGRPVGTVVEVRDVTREHEADAALREMNATLETQNAQLQDNAAELELQAEELQATSEELGARTAAAEAAERRLHAAFEQAPAIVAVTEGPEHRYVLANRRAEQIAGRGPLVGRTYREAFPELDAQGFAALLDRVYETGEPYVATEVPVTLERGVEGPERATFSFVYQPLLGVDGRTTGIMQHAVDVTAQVRAREVIAESERQLRTLADAIPTLAWTARPDGYIDWYNARWYEYTGTTPADMEGWGWRSVHDPEVLPAVLEGWTASVATGRPFEMTFPLRGADGVFRAFLTRVTPLRDAEGRVVRWIGTNTDVDAERAARDAAVQAVTRTTRLQALTAALAGARTLDDVASVVVAEAVAATGAKSGALSTRRAGTDEIEIVRQAGLTADVATRYARFPLTALTPTAECIRTGEPVWGETRDGALGLRERFPLIADVWESLGVSAAATVPLVVGGDVVGAMSFTFADPRAFSAEDRAFFLALGHQAAQALERARLFEAERAARAAAEGANKAKTDFLATMSHELRTPLNAIAGYAELLEIGIHGPVTDQQREAISRIQRSQRHLLGLINDVLNFAKLEAGHVEYRIGDVPVREALDAIEPLVAPQLRAKGLRFTRGGCGDVHAVRADAEKLQQILVNLLSNAIKFTAGGGAVTILCEDRGAAVSIRVHDTGIGIAAERLEHVFAPFVQIDRRLNAPLEGTGLGLAISRDLARGMGGDLTAESAPGAGSTFTLTLPRA